MPSSVVDPSKTKVDGLAFLGLSLSRNHHHSRPDNNDAAADHSRQHLGHPESVTHQTAFDFNTILDRDYDFVRALPEEQGWLMGGGEAGPPEGHKLAGRDSSHIEVMKIGTYRKDWGGLPLTELLATLAAGGIRIPQMEVVPTSVVTTPTSTSTSTIKNGPRKLEVRFEMDPTTHIRNQDFDAFCRAPLPVNWQLRFIQNQLFKAFVFPSRTCANPFHATLTNQVEFHSNEHRELYFDKCNKVIKNWRTNGPQPLNTIPRNMNGGLPLLEEDIVAGTVALVAPTINAPPVSSVSVKNKKDTDDDDEDKNDTTSEYKDYQCDTTEEDSDDEPTEFVSVQVFDVEGKSAVFQIPQSTDENEEEMEMEHKNNDEADDADDADDEDKEEERTTKRNERTGLYRTTWSDLIHAADAYPKEECEEHIVSKDKEVKIEGMHITSFDGERGAVEESIADNISEVKKEHEQEKNECPQTYICEYTKDDEPATARIVNLKKDQEKNDENQANNLVTSDSDRYNDKSVPMITSVEQDQELEQEQSHNMNENEESPIVSNEVYEKEVVIDTDVSKIDTQKPEHKEEQIKEQNQVKNDENKNKKPDIDDVLSRLKDRTKSLATDEINEDEDDKDHIVDVLSDAYKKQEKEDGTQYEGGSAVLLTALESTDFVACATIDDTLATDSTLDEEDDKHVVDLLSVAYKKQHKVEVAQTAALKAAEIKSVAAAELAAEMEEIGEKFETNKVTTKRVGLAIQEVTSFSIDRVAIEVKQFITADLNDSNEEKVTKKEEIGEEKDEIKSRLNPAIDGLENAYKKQELYQEEERDVAIEDEQGVVSAGIENLSTTKSVDSVFNDTIHLSTKDEDTGETPGLDVLVDAKNNPQEEEYDNNKATMLTVAALNELVTHDTTTTDEMIKTALAANNGDKIDIDVEEEEEEKEKTKDTEEIESEKITTDTEMKKTKNQKYQSGMWLFTDRNNVSHFFAPNFYPPYDTKEKRKIIFDVLKEEWDETSLSFKSYRQGSVMMEPASAATTTTAEKITVNKDPEKEKKSKKEDITSPLKVVDDMINDAVSAFTNIACSVFNNKYIDCS